MSKTFLSIQEFEFFKKTVLKQLTSLQKLTTTQDKEIKKLKSELKHKTKQVVILENRITHLEDESIIQTMKPKTNKTMIKYNPKPKRTKHNPRKSEPVKLNTEQLKAELNDNYKHKGTNAKGKIIKNDIRLEINKKGNNNNNKKKDFKEKKEDILIEDENRLVTAIIGVDKFDKTCGHNRNYSKIKILKNGLKMKDVLNDLEIWRVVYCKNSLINGVYQYKVKLIKGFKFSIGIVNAIKLAYVNFLFLFV